MQVLMMVIGGAVLVGLLFLGLKSLVVNNDDE